MDHPLDLSNQTEMDVSKQYENMEAVNDPICQFENCTCPKKHLTILESPKVTKQTKTSTRFSYNVSDSSYVIPPGNVSHTSTSGSKRIVSSDADSMVQFHPKRRKMERNKLTLGKSSSETDLQSHCNMYELNQQQMIPQNSYHNEERYCSSQENWERSNIIKNTGDYYQKNREMENTMYYDNPMANIWRNREIDQEQGERSKSINHIERLPKKRAYARNFSLEYENVGRSVTPTGAINETRQKLPSNSRIPESAPSYNKPSLPYRNDIIDTSLSSDDSSSLDNDKPATSSAVKSLGKQSSKPVRELTEKEKSFILLKADMMKEIDNDKDEEDVATFRKKLFKRRMRTVSYTPKQTSDPKTTPDITKEEFKPSESRMTALDYLMSKQLLETEDRAFKPRNHHIHQIINGEKSGNLCLMDIVELQVEVSLA